MGCDMGKLVKANLWAAEKFEKKSRPNVKRVCEWVDQKKIPGRLIGGEVFVDADAFELEIESTQPANDDGKTTFVDLLN